MPEATFSPPIILSVESVFVECRVTASNLAGSRSARSPGFAIPYISCCDRPPALAPRVTDLPAVSGAGRPYPVGTVAPLSCAPGTWTGSPPLSYAYQWLRNGVDIPEATEATYALRITEESIAVACEVTAHNVAGSTVARSADEHIPVISPPDRASRAFIVCHRFVPANDSSAAIRPALLAALICSKRTKIALVRKRNGLPFEFGAAEAGIVTAAWYKPPPAGAAARRTRTRSVLVAVGHAYLPDLHGSDVVRFRAKLTTQGRLVLKHAKRLRLVAKDTFTPTGRASVTVTGHILLRG